MCHDCGCGDFDEASELDLYQRELAEVEVETSDEEILPSDEQVVDIDDD